MTLAEWAVVDDLARKGLSATRIAAALRLPKEEVYGIVAEASERGDVERYRRACLEASKSDPRKDEVSAYLFVRGWSWRDLQALGLAHVKAVAPMREKLEYQRKQLELAKTRLACKEAA